jgi:alpha-L-rhamnosidase
MTDTAPSLVPYGLTCELREMPLGIDEPHPRLSWKLRSGRNGDRQTAYRVRVARRREHLEAAAELLWDTGRVASIETLHLSYDGAALASFTRYYFSVDTWDADGRRGGSAVSWFETAMLHRDLWTAAWIGRDPRTEPMMEPPRDHDRTARTRHLQPPACLRRTFPVAAGLVRARLYVSARGLYEVRVNGQRVGDEELAPGWTEYHKRVLYQTHDVTAALRTGENVLAAVLADGWWSGFVGFDARHNAQHYGDAPQLIAQLVLDFGNGAQRIIASDARWRERPGGLRYADLLMGEYFDARAEPEGWDRPGFDDSDWPRAVVCDRDTSVLVAAPDHPVRVVAELPAIEVSRRPNGDTLVDFGQNMVGRIRLTLRGAPAGTRMQLQHAEMLDSSGGLYRANLRNAEATDVYVAGGAAVEVFEPRFTYHGFRYATISGYPAVLTTADIIGRVLATDTPTVGEFGCSDDTVNQLVSNIRWGQRGNFVSVPTDCPQRDERLGWLADAQIFLPTACRTADVSAFFARWMHDVIDGQSEEGAFHDVAPLLFFHREGAPGWGDGGVIVPWHLYRTYGDRRVLDRAFDAMVAWVHHIQRHNPDLIWRHRVGNHYGDWLQVDAQTPRDLMATAYFARSANLVAQAAEVLDRPEDAKRFAELHAAIRAAFIQAFVAEDGRVHGGTQTAYLLALAFDLLPSDLVATTFGHLVADIEARGRHLTTGFIGVPLLCPVLTDHGRPDLAYALLHQDTYPSWAYSIRQGATTIWERWDGWTDDRGFQSAEMNSFNHYSLGSVGDWLHGRVAGIDQEADSVAYRRLILRPTTGGHLTWARARYESPRGEISCGWRLSDDLVTVDVTIPPGVTAQLHVPTGTPASVRVNGAPAPVDSAVVHLTAGSHHITAHRPHREVPGEHVPGEHVPGEGAKQ